MKVFLLILTTVLFFSISPARADQDSLFRQLRDEGIENIGWVAGNSYGHPVWPEVKGYVGKDGDYYNLFVRLAPKGSDHETEAFHNVSLYNKSFEEGQKQPFNEHESTLRTQRILQIVEELKALLP